MTEDAPRNGGQLARVFALLTAAFAAWAAYALATSSMPPLAADRGRIDSAIELNLIVSGVVFLGAHLALVLVLLRRPREARIPRENIRVEMLWTALTAAILVALLVNSEIDARALAGGDEGADAPKPVVVEVVAQQFAWNFRLPGEDGIFGRTDPRLVDQAELNFIGLDKKDPASEDDILLPQGLLILPAGREIKVRLRSLDVIHSFFVASFRVKRDAMPGLQGEFTFTPTTPGSFELACAEHCGLGHYRMRGLIEVVPEAEWAGKVKEATQ
ncbi:MAG: cytochrome c oxidase subunit II [Vicinamibacteria bacterium]|nr:cytochrome c oxidase subunit II [Vicinamibacteria bacterium]